MDEAYNLTVTIVYVCMERLATGFLRTITYGATPRILIINTSFILNYKIANVSID